MKISTNAKASVVSYQLAPTAVVRIDDDGVTVLDTRRGRYWRGNDSAVPILERVAAPATCTQIVAAMQAVYDVPDDVARQDSSALLRQLCRAGLVRKVRS